MRNATLLLIVGLLAGTAWSEDGKVYVKSEPAGADVFLNGTGTNGKVDTKPLGKTPSLVVVPVGEASFLLVLKGYKPSMFDVTVKPEVINKPDPVKLEQETVKVDVVFEPDWIVFVDGKLAKEVNGKQPTTPCTINTPLGSHVFVVARDGFLDINQCVEIKEKATVEIKAKSSKGTSVLLKSEPVCLPRFLLDPERWSTFCWSGTKWMAYPLSKMTITQDTEVKNTTGIHVHALLNYNKIVSGDFECKCIVDLDDKARMFLLPNTGEDKFLSIGLPSGKNVNIVFKREKDIISAEVGRQKVEVKRDVDTSVSGMIGFYLNTNQKIKITYFQLEGK